MSNQTFYIPSGAVCKNEYNIDENNWFTTETSRFNEDKEIPFLKLIIDLIGALSKYYRNQTRNSPYERYPELAQEILETASGLANNYLKIKYILRTYFAQETYIQLITALKFIDNI